MLTYWMKKIINVINNDGLGGFLKKSFQVLLGNTFSRQPSEFVIIYKVLRNFTQTGIMIDVGAAHGDSLRLFAKQGWKIYAFEPEPKNRSVLTQVLGHYSNIEIDPRAVSSEDKSNVQFYTSNISFGLGSLAPFHQTHAPGNLVNVVTLRSYIEARKIEKVNFLKIDAEGFDYFVLKGFPWEKPQIHPDIILCEFEDTKTKDLGYSWKDMAEFLQEQGYQVIISEWLPIDDYSKRHKWRRHMLFPGELVDPNAWGNILATKSDMVKDKIMEHFSSFT